MTFSTFRAMRLELEKLAEEDVRPTTGQKLWRAAKVVGAGLGGYGLGSALGYGGAYAANHLLKKMKKPIPPEFMHAAGRKLADLLAFSTMLWQAQQQGEIDRAVKGQFTPAKR